MANLNAEVTVKLDRGIKKRLDDMASKTAALVKKLMTRRKTFIDAYIKAYLAENPGTKITDCVLVEQYDNAAGTFTWYLKKKGAKYNV